MDSNLHAWLKEDKLQDNTHNTFLANTQHKCNVGEEGKKHNKNNKTTSANETNDYKE